LPMLAHRGAGELIVRGMALTGLLLIDQMNDGELGEIRKVLDPTRLVLAQVPASEMST
jgi:hypothetical protein